MSFSKMDPVIIVHGGAANVIPPRVCGKVCGAQNGARAGFDVLAKGGSAVDAVEAAIKDMESNEFFNAGFGSVLNLDGEVEMDASIMDGKDLSAGGVACVRDVEHPITLARLVREKSPHVLIAGKGASKFAEENGLEIVSPDKLVSSYAKEVLEMFKRLGSSADTTVLGGTVGAIALDKNGNIAAGTSTGGTNGKLVGRIGDVPIIGSCTYADNDIGGVSCTGHGEAIMKVCLGYSIIKEMELGRNPREATAMRVQFLNELTKSRVGAIALSRKGEVGLYFTSSMMPWAYIKKGELHYGIETGDDQCECL